MDFVHPSGERLPRRIKTLFGLGDWGPTTTNTVVMFFFSFFLTDVARLPPAYAAPVLLIGGIWDAINDPLVGALSDRVRTRWGRRRPFFLFGALPFALSFAMLWWVPPWPDPRSKAVYYAIAHVLFDTALTIVSVPYAALTPELTRDSNEQTTLNGYRTVVSMIGGLVAAVTVPALVRMFPSPAQGYLVTGTLLGMAGAIPYFLLFFGIRERSDTFQQPFQHHPDDGFQIRHAWGVLRCPEFRTVLGIYAATWTTVSVVASLLQYYVTHCMKLGHRLDAILGTLQIASLASVPLIVWLARRVGKRQTYALGTSWWGLVMLALMFLPAGAPMLALLLAALAGPGIATAYVVPWSMIPDALEADAASSGVRREGIGYGILAFVQKASSALGLALVQGILHVSGYVSGSVPPPSTLQAIRWMIGPLPVCLIALALLLIWRYPRSRSTLEVVPAAQRK